MRIAFTIIHNGLHHLKHNSQAERILQDCDWWVVVEGAAHSNGSTRWCKQFPSHLHRNGRSVDGTHEYLLELQRQHPNLVYVPSDGFWESKDVQVNRAVEEVRKLTSSCWLWQIDIDEQWTAESMTAAEAELTQTAGAFRADCYVGKNLRAIGEWGECRSYGYIRLWKWNGESFICHEPPLLQGAGKDAQLLSPRFKHYNYYFKQDVEFKNAWYGGHEDILDRWELLNSLPQRSFPLHISNLITGEWGRTNSAIVYENQTQRIVQIGSHDGTDMVREIVRNGNYKCLLVEPNPDLMETLKHSYSFTDKCLYENCAVSSFDGEIPMHFSLEDTEIANSQHSSISLNHVLVHGTPIEKVLTKTVPCLTLHSLLKKHGWETEEIEHLFIDTEGHDCEILLATNLSALNIRNITFETVHTDGTFTRGETFNKTVEHLQSCGYFVNTKLSTPTNITFTAR